MPQISASLLAADYARLGEEITRAEQAGVDSFHFDMMDGHYVHNLALTPQHLKALRNYTSLPFHVHLELEQPDFILEKFNPLGAECVILQWDTLTNPQRSFGLIRDQGAKVGLSVNLYDPLETASQLLAEVDLFLLLGVMPGFGGQKLDPDTYYRVKQIRELANLSGLDTTLAVDGGVNLENIPALLKAGADCFIMGSAIFQAASISDFIQHVKKEFLLSITPSN